MFGPGRRPASGSCVGVSLALVALQARQPQQPDGDLTRKRCGWRSGFTCLSNRGHLHGKLESQRTGRDWNQHSDRRRDGSRSETASSHQPQPLGSGRSGSPRFGRTNQWRLFLLAAQFHEHHFPLTNWAIVATNAFDAQGNFSNQIPLTPGAPQIFYQLQLP